MDSRAAAAASEEEEEEEEDDDDDEDLYVLVIASLSPFLRVFMLNSRLLNQDIMSKELI